MKRCVLGLGVLLLAALLLAGCSASGMKNVERTGFLSSYSDLKPGTGDQAAMRYLKPGVDFKPYNKLMFERFVVLLSDSAASRQIDPAMLKELTDYYQNAVFNAVKGGYEIVDQPGPGVARVRIAITELKPSNPTANTLSSIVPIGIAVSAATKATSGDNLGTGEAGTEFEMLDSVTGERLMAAMDKRQGGKGVFRGKWEDTKEAFDYWAKRFRQQLDLARGVAAK